MGTIILAYVKLNQNIYGNWALSTVKLKSQSRKKSYQSPCVSDSLSSVCKISNFALPVTGKLLTLEQNVNQAFFNLFVRPQPVAYLIICRLNLYILLYPLVSVSSLSREDWLAERWLVFDVNIKSIHVSSIHVIPKENGLDIFASKVSSKRRTITSLPP